MLARKTAARSYTTTIPLTLVLEYLYEKYQHRDPWPDQGEIVLRVNEGWKHRGGATRVTLSFLGPRGAIRKLYVSPQELRGALRPHFKGSRIHKLIWRCSFGIITDLDVVTTRLTSN